MLLVLDGSAADEFLDAVKTEAAGIAPAPMLHAGILSSYQAGVARLADTGGVKLLTAVTSDSPNMATCAIFQAQASLLESNQPLAEEVFGPSSVVLRCKSVDQMVDIARTLDGNLTATVHGEEEEIVEHACLIRMLQRRVGRLVFNGYPTGIGVCAAMHHGGPYSATTHSGVTSIGEASILRFAKPTCHQNLCDAALPVELRNHNEQNIWRLVDGELTRDDLH